MAYFLDLAAAEPLFYGTTRRIYRHPQDASLLVKVPSRQEEARRAANMPKWKQRFKPTGIANITNLREVAEILRLNPEAEVQLPHIYSLVGLVATNFGWGQIVKAEYGADGGYAPTIEQIANQPQLYQEALDKFLRWAAEAPAVFIDLEPWNCVLARRGDHDEIVVIDGLGEKTVIPFRTYFPRLNYKKNAAQIKQFLASLELVKQGKGPHRRRA